MAIDGDVDLGDLSGQETPFLLDGSLEPALSLPLLALAATGYAGSAIEAYEAGLALPGFVLQDASTADGMALPAFLLAGHGEAGTYISGRLDLLAPSLDGSIEPPLALLAPQLAASGQAGTVLGAALLTLAPVEVVAAGGDNAGVTIPAFALDASMLAGAIASASLALPRFSASSSGLEDTLADGNLTLGLLQLDASGDATAVTYGEVTLDMVQVDAIAGTGGIGEASLTVPLFALAADGLAESIGNATITLPVFGLAATTVSLGAPVATAIVLNTRLKGVTRYEGLNANSFAQFAGLQLAATPDGIVALMGETDLDRPIAASITSGTSDLGSAERKRIEAAYVGYRADGDMEMTLITDEHHEYTYRLAPRQIGDMLHGARVKFGRGVDGRYWQWMLANLHGGGFELASLQLNVNPLSRSV